MFYYLNGTLEYLDANNAVIDCGGVGYLLTISGNTLGKLSGKTGEKIKLFTYMAVKEDDVCLFGFHSESELNAFKLLITVSGVGPKAAMSVLSLMSPDKLYLSISTGDSKSISGAQGVGQKTAARIILELKDKVSKSISSENVSSSDVTMSSTGGVFADAENTLLTLGYSRNEALKVLREIDIEHLSLEDVVKSALKKLI